MVPDCSENGRKCADNLGIWEPDERPAKALDCLLPVIVVKLPVFLVVNTAIELDDEFEGNAGEVGEVAINGMLATEAEAVEPGGAQVLPQGGLSMGLALSQLAGADPLCPGRHAG